MVFISNHKSLKHQYKKMFDVMEKYKPELCLKMNHSDLSEFHHVMWDMPFFETLYKVDIKKHLRFTTHIYCKVVTNSSHYGNELCAIEVYTVIKTLFRKKEKVEKKVISSMDDEFVKYFEMLLSVGSDDIDLTFDSAFDFFLLRNL